MDEGEVWSRLWTRVVIYIQGAERDKDE
jgi:hypothetical protein